MTTPSIPTCSCGEIAPHTVMRRTTADGIAIDIWHDGAITGRLGRALPGVPITRPRTERAIDLARATASLVASEVEIHDAAELPRLYACARRVAAQGGSPGDLRAAFVDDETPAIRFTWDVYAADRDGTPTVRVARLDRVRWPGLVVWHERGRYELLALRRGFALGARSRETLEATGISFVSQRELIVHLLASVAA
jgi:hypothetical protein